MIKQILLVGAGGAVGSILRYLTSVFFTGKENFPLPYATLLVNVLGCFLIGLFINLIPTTHNLRFLLIAGFCGGFTTFSTFAGENINLMNNNQTGLAFVYILLSCITGIGAVWLGMYLTK